MAFGYLIGDVRGRPGNPRPELAVRDSWRPAERNSLPITFRAVTSSQGSGSSGSSATFRQAARNTSLTTSSAS
jgi:hypothetical protein